MIFLFAVLASLAITLFIPCLILFFWKKRPLWAFIAATTVSWFTLALEGIVRTIENSINYGKIDLQLIAGGISEAIVDALLWMVFCIPILLAFQWFILRRHRKTHPLVDADKTFS